MVVSPVGAVPKDLTDVRPIHHLSAPRNNSGISVNNTLKEEYKTVRYVSFKEIVEIAYSAGKGGYIWAADAADAYLRVPVNKRDWKFLGIRWNDHYFILTCLPFGLSSSCLIYTLFADAIEWVVVHHNSNIFHGICNNKHIQVLRHYLDDFVGAHPNKQVAQAQFDALISWFNKLNIPTRDKKCSPPATAQKILGSIFDTVTQTVRLPKDKAEKYSAAINSILIAAKRRKRIAKKDLQSVNGKLRFAARHIWCGATYCRALEERINSTKDNGYTRLNKQICADLQWWLSVLPKLSVGIPFEYILYPRKNCKYTMWTDAFVNSTTAGIGGYNCQGQYFQHIFDLKKDFKTVKKPDINWFEMAAVVIALIIWGNNYINSSVYVWCDNGATVGQISKRSAPFKRSDLMKLIRLVTKNSIQTGYHFYIDQIPGKTNKTADALSRFFKEPFKFLSKQIRAKIDKKPTCCVSGVISCVNSFCSV